MFFLTNSRAKDFTRLLREAFEDEYNDIPFSPPNDATDEIVTIDFTLFDKIS
jgi:hypothetical protein